MWLFTTDGFYSCVLGGRDNEGRPRRRMVAIRARRKEHLSKLRIRHSGLNISEIMGTPKADYPYRCWVTVATFAKMMAVEAERVDYDNFKREVMLQQGKSKYEQALHEIWGTMKEIE